MEQSSSKENVYCSNPSAISQCTFANHTSEVKKTTCTFHSCYYSVCGTASIPSAILWVPFLSAVVVSARVSKMSHLTWMIVRNNNAFLLKKRNINKPFSTEPSNLTNLSSYRYSGLVHRKSVGIVDTPDKKGFTVVYKKAKAGNKPAKSTVRSTMKAGARRSLYKLKTLLKANKYRVDLTKVALRRASAVLRSQKPLPAKKTRTTKKAD